MYDNCDEVVQRFWAITKSVPNPLAGVIDIPVGEGKVGNIRKVDCFFLFQQYVLIKILSGHI